MTINSKWHTIWQNKGAQEDLPLTLENLLAVDGYDILGNLTPAAWRNYINYIKTKVDLQPGQSVYEVGCGAGAFLWPFFEQNHPLGGLDYAANLITIAQQAMPTGQFHAGGADTIDPTIPYDVVLSQGVFLYFPNYDYAADVLHKMVTKATKCIAILDVPDKAKQEYALQIRRGKMGEQEYQQYYAGLDHLYYPKQWFHDQLAPLGLNIHIEDQQIDNYLHSSYRYNVFCHLP
ncbi:MAG TPA: methyltransferase [Anaerolineae bacterium]|nr:methyltransferase [Anaerolineae bacterium]